MCGICGSLRFDGTTPSLTLLEKMLSAIQRRGPDHQGGFCEGPIALGHRRLAVIDLSVHANQPMIDRETGTVIVFNGTIYNYPQLQKQLRGLGYSFVSNGDTEVILKSYAQWGEACVEHFNGIYAFAIWNLHQQSLFLARDRLGIKPLYYSQNGQGFYFASNSQALLSMGSELDTSLDPVALHHHFTLHAVIPAPRTILQGIRKLAPGHTMTISESGRSHERKYWQLSSVPLSQPFTEQEWLESTESILRSAIHHQQQTADVPVGLLLSGGLDSSLLAALLVEMGYSTSTFSIGFEDAPEEVGHEFEYSQQVANHLHTRHHRYQVSNHTVLERLPEVIQQMAEPMVGQDAAAFYFLAELVAKENKVVLSGQGADELFAGYFWYPQMAAAEGENDLHRFASRYFDRDHHEYNEMITESFQGEDYTSLLIAKSLAQIEGDRFLDRVLNLDVTTLIVDDPVKRVDNMTMAWGLEARVPFLDHELVEWVARMPSELKLRERGKYPLKAIARRYLPDTIIDRPKGYFPLPALKFVRGNFLATMREILHSTVCRQRGLYQTAYIEKLLAAPEQHLTRLQGSKLWHLTLLEWWLQLNRL